MNIEPQNRTGTFKLKKQDTGFVFQTPSGKFIARIDDDRLALADQPGSVLLFNIEEQPSAH